MTDERTPDGLDALRQALTAPVTDEERALVAAANAELDRTAQLDESTKNVIFTGTIAKLHDYVKNGNAPDAGPRARAMADEATDRLHGKAIDEDIREHGGATFPERAGR